MSVAQPPLSPRQLQVLSLLREGKGNKEIAHQLGIGVGTVKQHVIALLRKIHATNRTMAAGLPLAAPPLAEALPQLSQRPGVVLQWRPACVLSLAVSWNEAEAAPPRGALQSALAACTRDIECTMVAGAGAAEVIFGLHHADERSQKIATDLAAAVRHELRRCSPAVPALRAGLASGFLLASLERRGGWTGEIIAGNLIAQARSCRDNGAADTLALDGESRRQLARTLSQAAEDIPATLPLDQPAPLRRKPARAVAIFDREAERAQLRAYLDRLTAGEGGVVVVEGEAGMGKTSLCRAMGGEAAERGLAWVEWRCGDEPGRLLRALERTAGRPPREGCAALAPRIRAALERVSGQALFIDDVNHATADELALVHLLAEVAQSRPVLLVLGARRARQPALAVDAARIKLGRLTPEVAEQVVRANTMGSPDAEAVRAAAALSAGVPLFAAELARRRVGERIPVSLATVVLARLDGLPFDRRLLGLVARHGPLPERELARLWDGEPDSLEREIAEAIGMGLLARNGEAGDRIAFAHPLVGQLWREMTPETESVE